MEKRGRVLGADEAQKVLETTATKRTLVSWFAPFYAHMLDAIEHGKKTVIFDGKLFTVKRCENGKDYVFRYSRDFVPMIRTNAETIQYAINSAE